MINGLLHALILDEKGGAHEINNTDTLHQWQPEQGKLWVHMDYSQVEAVNWLKRCELLSDYELESLTAEETRPRIAATNDGHMLFLRGINLNPAQSPEDMVSVRLFINNNIVITTRKRQLLSIQTILTSLKNNKGPKSISDLVCTLAQELTARMQSVIDALDETLDDFEAEIDEPSKRFNNQGLSQLRRQTIALKRYLKPQKEALNSMLNQAYSWLYNDDKAKLNETINLLTRYLEGKRLANDT